MKHSFQILLLQYVQYEIKYSLKILPSCHERCVMLPFDICKNASGTHALISVLTLFNLSAEDMQAYVQSCLLALLWLIVIFKSRSVEAIDCDF